ncbi:MAG: hypothetical protein L0207_02480 [Chlamydiae bacterium]|nr:hypothetical protein [Chlamydiota bacterium]
MKNVSLFFTTTIEDNYKFEVDRGWKTIFHKISNTSFYPFQYFLGNFMDVSRYLVDPEAKIKVIEFSKEAKVFKIHYFILSALFSFPSLLIGSITKIALLILSKDYRKQYFTALHNQPEIPFIDMKVIEYMRVQLDCPKKVRELFGGTDKTVKIEDAGEYSFSEAEKGTLPETIVRNENFEFFIPCETCTLNNERRVVVHIMQNQAKTIISSTAYDLHFGKIEPITLDEVNNLLTKGLMKISQIRLQDRFQYNNLPFTGRVIDEIILRYPAIQPDSLPMTSGAHQPIYNLPKN